MKESRECISCKKSGLLNRMACFVSKFAPRRKAERNQSRTKAFETISLPNQLIQRQPVLPLHGKSVLDSKIMVEGIRPNLCVKFALRRKARWTPITYERLWNYLSSQSTDTKANYLALSLRDNVIDAEQKERDERNELERNRKEMAMMGDSISGFRPHLRRLSLFSLNYITKYIFCYSRFRRRRRKSCALRELFYSVLVFERLYF